RRLRKPFTSYASAHVSKNIPVGSSVDAAVYAAAAPSSFIPTDADKGKAPMVNDSLPADLLSEQELESEFAIQQEELAQKAQAEGVASLTEHGPGMSDHRHRELDAAQLIYTEADWLELMAKIATNSALFKQLLGDDVTEENMNERLGMLLLRKRRKLAEQSQVKPMTKMQQRDYMRDFVKNNSASVYNQGWTMKKVKAVSIAQLRIEFEYIQQHLERFNLLNFRRSTFRPKPTLDAPSTKRANQGAPQVPAASSQVPAGVPAASSIPADVSVHAATSLAPTDISVPAISPAHATASVPAETMVYTVESHLDAPLTASEHVSTEPTVAAPTPSSLRTRRKHIEKKRVTPIVDMADAAMIKFDSDNDSDDDLLPYASYAGWEMVPSPLGSVHAYHDMAGHTKHFTTLHKLQYMVEKTDLHNLLMMRMPLISGVIRTAGAFAADVSYPLNVATLERMMKHGLEVLKLLVGGDLTMAEQLISFIKAAFSMLNLLLDPCLLIPAGFWLLLLLVAAGLVCSCCWNKDAILELTSADLSRILKLMMSHSRLGEDCWELQKLV
nr:JmjC domain-containing protein [Tanacetum cinerariifolium]